MDKISIIRQKLEESRELMKRQEADALLNDTLGDCLKTLAETIEFDVASLYVYSTRLQTLHKVADFGGGVNFIERLRFDNGYGLAAWVAKKQQPVYLQDIHRGSRHGHAPIRSYLSMPILQMDEVVAVVNLAHIKPQAFDRKALALIKAFFETLKPAFELYLRQQNAHRVFPENDLTHR